MRPDRIVLLLLTLSACGRHDERDTSQKARVVPKSGDVWAQDLSRGLGLEPQALCTELGQFDCITDAHLVTLGGVDPARLGIDEPLANALVSAPIAADRVATSACSERYRRDKEGPAVIFGPILDKDTSGHRKDVAKSLVQRLLVREPNKEELDALESLHDVLEPLSKDLAHDWAIGACITVATSTEALFY